MGGAGRTGLVVGLASYLDAGALVTSGLAVGGIYADTLPLGDGAVGALLGTQTLAFAGGAVAGGRLADRIGRRRVLLVSLVLYALGVALLAGAQGPATLAAGLVLSGLGIGADLPSSLALASESAPVGRKGRQVALTQVFWGVGIGATGLLALLLSPWGEAAARLLYLHLLLVALVTLGLRLSVRETVEWTEARATRTVTPVRDRLGPLRGPAATAALATGLYYALWTLGANTLGQFKPYLWVQVLGGSAGGASALLLLALPLGLTGSLVFAAVADSGRRTRWVAVGSLTVAAGWALLLVVPGRATFVLLVAVSALGATLAGESLYKVATQELVPTLQRATVQGLTMAVARVLAAGFAVVTPALARADLSLLVGIVLVTQLLAAGIALAWLPRLRQRAA